ncbi:MAG: hypothetical protein FWF77_07390 [Defluviitaleaceae bacterium]|nr:hypothetical protein [Defluviitaleaceae bacterium]
MIEALLHIVLWTLVVLVALVLFVLLLMALPIKYSVNASNDGNTMVVARVSWLLKIVRFTYELRDGREKSTFHVLFFRVDRPPRWWRRVKRWARRMLQGRDKPKKKPLSASPKPKSPPPAPPRTPPPSPKSDESFLDKLSDVYSSLTDERGKIIIKHAVALLGDLIKVLRPKRFDVSGVIGTGCPFNTAMVLGTYESIAGMFDIRKNVRFAGDFNTDDPLFRYNADVRGKANILRMVTLIVRFALHEPVREWLLTLWTDDF